MDIRLPVEPPALKPPAWVWVPTQWRRVDDLSILPLADRITDAPAAPWLLVEEIPRRVVPAPPEVFLRELYPLDVGDEDAIVRWCGRWGVPRVPRSLEPAQSLSVEITVDALATAPGGDDNAWPAGPSAEANGPPNVTAPEEVPPTKFTRPLRQALRETAGVAGAHADLSGLTWSTPGGPALRPVPVATACYSVALYRALVAFFMALPKQATIENTSILDNEILAGFWAPTGVSVATFSVRTRSSTPCSRRSSCSTSSWPRPIPGRSTCSAAISTQCCAAPRSGTSSLWSSPPSSTEREPARRCPNCGGWFHHQIGRARKGQQRLIGVKYCSDACAHAAAQRSYRKRKAGKQ